MKQFLNRSFRIAAIAMLPAATLGWPALNAAQAAKNNPFETCTVELLEAQVSQVEAAAACAEALEPEDLSWCVLKIYELTPVDSRSALSACFRVRRPLDLADCTIDVTDEFQDRDRAVVSPDTGQPLALSTLETCRRSLLPRRFAECAIGLSREVDFSALGILNTCLEAEAYPELLFPRRTN
ncbi:MAG: hypothetical protein SVX43_02330 [Cyanobacteriota bacterium]|nr:hypothetical protein [Cyanobacteriota bacterium]